MKISRREFMKYSTKMSAAALLSGVVGTGRAFGGSGAQSHPNILLLMVDQQHMPPPGYGPDEGYMEGLKEILGFQQTISPDNPFARSFPGYLRLRKNAVVLRTHYTASSACVPSRTCIMTGQYSSETGVDQTDGSFKSPEDVTWLDPDGTPTIGDWFRAVGYKTHYYGKWHVSYPEAPGSLDPWGFDNWESSFPEPHGEGADNLGVYRDVGFAQNVVQFLQGKDSSDTPWLAVGSLVNPHDNGNWPPCWQLPNDNGVVPWKDFPPPPGIPAKGDKSLPGYDGIIIEDLNPDGLPQDTCSLPPTFDESLSDKPSCHYDYSLKFGLMTKSLWEYSKVPSPHPFQFQEDPKAWSLGYNEFYVYCHYLADLRLRKMLQALDDNGFAENTIVVFLSDHGEMAMAHGGMMQKWHNAYEEITRVPMVVSSPLVNKKKGKMREILQPTSSIDLAPTLLGLAGYDVTEVLHKMEATHGKSKVKAFVGADLSSHIRGESEGDILGPDGKPRTGAFYMSNDMITELGATAKKKDDRYKQYQLFLTNVEDAISDGYPLKPGPVTQPNNVRALCTGDWKIVHYVDYYGHEQDEWELYCLTSDPIERTNLVDFRTGDVREDVTVPGMTREQLRAKNKQLKEELARQEALMLGESG